MPSPTIHTLWRNNCTKQLLPISSRLAALVQPPLIMSGGSEHSSAPYLPRCQDILQFFMFRSISALPVASNLLLQIFQGYSERSMSLGCDQQAPSGWLLASPLDPEGVGLLLWDGLEAKFRQRGPQGDPKFCFMPLEVTLSFLLILPKDSAIRVSLYRGKTTALKTSKGKNLHVGSFKGKAAGGISNEVLLLCLGWKLLGK